jgi:SAM-dependent methyltransferase
MLTTVPISLDSLLMRYCGLPYALVTRDRMIHDRMRFLVRSIIKENRKLAVLDAGCGSGLALLYLNHYCPNQVTSYLGVDLSTKRVAKRFGFVTLPHSFQNLDLCSEWTLNTFDIIFCSEVIEHVIEDGLLLKRLAAHLNPEGVLLITTPNKQFVTYWAKSFEGFDETSQTQDGGHVRIGYSLTDLETLAGRAGLVVREQCFLSRMRYNELRHREHLRKHGQHVNTVRHNWSWLIGSIKKSSDRSHEALSHWTTAVALIHAPGRLLV